MERAYSRLTVKSFDEEQRVIRGIATTPEVDRMGDIVVPGGVNFKNPFPLLWQHQSDKPVGTVSFDKPTANGITFEARLANIKEPGTLKDRVDEAWQSVRAGLVRAVSIGFRSLEGGVEVMKGGGLKFTATEVMELSLVTIPANASATIHSIKSIDDALLAASGHKQRAVTSPGASGTQKSASSGNPPNRSPKGNVMQTISQLREERNTKASRLQELVDLRKAESRKFTDEERGEFDTLGTEIEDLDDEIRVKNFHTTNAAAATGVDGTSAKSASASRGGISFVKTADVDDSFKGQGFIRQLKAKGAAFIAAKQGDRLLPSEFAQKHWGRTNPNLVQLLKANEVPGGGTGSGEWGAELVGIDNRYRGDFVEFLYSQTVYDRLGLRRAPKNVSVKGQDGAATGYWVGESKGIPVSKPDFSTVDLTILKAAGLCVASKELLADSDPAAEIFIRDSLVQAIAQRIDTTFLSATAASSGVSPAGILNGLSALHTTGSDEAAVRSMIKQLYSQFITDKNSSGLVLVMSPGMAKAIGLIVNALGQTSFPGLGTDGGMLLGDRVVTGDNVDPSTVLLIKPSDIWLLDEGLQVSMSDSAMVEQNSAPTGATDTPTAASVTIVSTFQEDSVAIKVVRRTSFKKRRANAVVYVDDADFDGTAS